MTTAGKRNRRILFERAGSATDDYGGEVSTWAPHAEAWAEVLLGSGQERREAAQEAGSQAATFIVLWTPTLATVTIKDRIVGLGSTWDITNAAPMGLNREIHFTAARNV